MDYVLKLINNKIDRLESINKNVEAALFYQVRVEYILTLNIGYLWNKNLKKLNSKDKKKVMAQVSRPTVGTLLDLCRTLDIENETALSKDANKKVNEYPEVRNRSLGHGYTHEDKIVDYKNKLKEIYESFLSTAKNKQNIVTKDLDFVFVTDLIDGNYSGTKYSADNLPAPWQCGKSVYDFKAGNLYITENSNDYFRISPFVIINEDDEVFLYSYIQEPLLGRTSYNQLLKTSQCLLVWDEFKTLSTNLTDSKSVSANGTVFNHFTKNYKQYIPLEIKKRIETFLSNRSSVCATIWGHGGVGKTSTVQSLCEDLCIGAKKFDYIIFLSAKDRRFNYETGQVENISSEERIENLESIIKNINNIIFDPESIDVKDLLNFNGKMLLIIDDFETFSSEEKNKIREFITLLNINKHKVLITTRADIRAGEHIPTNELSEKETLSFLLDVAKVEFPTINIKKLESSVNENGNLKKIYEITSGRPLFIFQFVHLYARDQNSIDKVLKNNIKEASSAIDFLYERLFDYLSASAQHLFIVLGKLVTSDEDLSHLLSKAKYVLDMDDKGDEFNDAVDELIKLKIIEVKEGSDVFQIYTKEIWQIMHNQYEQFQNEFKQKWIEKLNVVGHKKYSVDQSLLESADRLALSGEDSSIVIRAYKKVLERPACPEELKISAIEKLCNYYYFDLQKIDAVINLLDEKCPLCHENRQFIKIFAEYNWISDTSKNRKKAVQELLRYFQERRNLQDKAELELLSMLVTYRTKIAMKTISDLEVNKKRFNDLEYSERKEEIFKLLKDIFQSEGKQLFRHLQRTDIYEPPVSSDSRNKIIVGLLEFLNLAHYLEQFKLAEEVCLFAFEILAKNALHEFAEKYKAIFEAQGKSRFRANNQYLNLIKRRDETRFLNLNDDKSTQMSGIKVKKLGSLRDIERPIK